MNVLVFIIDILLGFLYLTINSLVIGIFLSKNTNISLNNLSEKIILGSIFVFNYIILFYLVNYYLIHLHGLFLSLVATLLLLSISVFILVYYRKYFFKYILSNIRRRRLFLKVNECSSKACKILLVIMILVFTSYILFNYYANSYDYYDYYHYIAANYNIAGSLLHRESILFNTIIVMFNGIYYGIINPRALGLFLFVLFSLTLQSIVVNNFTSKRDGFLTLFILSLPSIIVLYSYEFLYLESVFITVLMFVLWSITKNDVRLVVLVLPLLLFTKGYGLLIFISIIIILLYIYIRRDLNKVILYVSSILPILFFSIAVSVEKEGLIVDYMLKILLCALFLGLMLLLINIDFNRVRNRIQLLFNSFSIGLKEMFYLVPYIIYFSYFMNNIISFNAVNFEINYDLFKIIASLNLSIIASGTSENLSLYSVFNNAILGIFNNLALPYIVVISLLLSIIVYKHKNLIGRGLDFLDLILLMLVFNYTSVFIVKFNGSHYCFNYRYVIPLSVLLSLFFYRYTNRLNPKVTKVMSLSLASASFMSMLYLSLNNSVFDKRATILFYQKNPLFTILSVLPLLFVLILEYVGKIDINRITKKWSYGIVIIILLSIIANASIFTRGLIQDITPDNPEYSQYIYSNNTLKRYYSMYVDYMKLIQYIDEKYLNNNTIILTINIPLMDVNPTYYLKTAGNIYFYALRRSANNISCILMPKDNCMEYSYIIKRDLLLEHPSIGRINTYGRLLAESDYFYFKCVND